MLAILKLISVAYAKGAAVEIAKTDNGTIMALFPAQWQLTLSILSPIGMLLLWILQQVWESIKGEKKTISKKLEHLEMSHIEINKNLAQLKAILGTDLDHKIERKIERAFDYYEKGRKS